MSEDNYNEPEFTRRDLNNVTMQLCSCGGEPADGDPCDACMIWHLMTEQITREQYLLWARKQRDKLTTDNDTAEHWYDRQTPWR